MKDNKVNSVDQIVLDGIMIVVSNSKKPWTGTMTKLSSTLRSVVGNKDSKRLPGSPAALRVVVNRVVNKLRNRRVSVRFNRTTDHTRTRYVQFSR